MLTPSEYQAETARTLAKSFTPIDQDILHSIIGLTTESGELMSEVKKALFYFAPLDRDRLLDEAGDALWYLATLFNALGTGIEPVMALNLAKLRQRYPEKFTAEQALQKNIFAEAQVYRDNLKAPFRHMERVLQNAKLEWPVLSLKQPWLKTIIDYLTDLPLQAEEVSANRFVIMVQNRVVDDANSYGYRTIDNAVKAFHYKLQIGLDYWGEHQARFEELLENLDSAPETLSEIPPLARWFIDPFLKTISSS